MDSNEGRLPLAQSIDSERKATLLRQALYHRRYAKGPFLFVGKRQHVDVPSATLGIPDRMNCRRQF